MSPWSLADTVARLSAVVAARRMEVVAVIDHSGRARDVGLDLRDTKLVSLAVAAAPRQNGSGPARPDSAARC